MEDIKFSVLIPAYKGKYLNDCISSILQQSYSNFEIIIVNDASPENLAGIVSEFKDNRIKYFENERGCGAEHVVDNWNKCLEKASGKYAICMGDDDRLRENCLEAYLSLIENHPGLGVYHIQAYMIDENNRIIDAEEGKPEYETVYSYLFHVMKSSRMQFIGDFLFDIDLLRKHNGFFSAPYAWHADRISVMEAAKERGIANSAEYGFEYRVSSQRISSSREISLGKLMAWNQIDCWYKTFFDELEAKNSEDKAFYELSKKNYKAFLNRQVSREARDAFRQKPSVFIKLFFGREMNLISRKRMLRIFLESFKG